MQNIIVPVKRFFLSTVPGSSSKLLILGFIFNFAHILFQICAMLTTDWYHGKVSETFSDALSSSSTGVVGGVVGGPNSMTTLITTATKTTYGLFDVCYDGGCFDLVFEPISVFGSCSRDDASALNSRLQLIKNLVYAVLAFSGLAWLLLLSTLMTRHYPRGRGSRFRGFGGSSHFWVIFAILVCQIIVFAMQCAVTGHYVQSVNRLWFCDEGLCPMLLYYTGTRANANATCASGYGSSSLVYFTSVIFPFLIFICCVGRIIALVRKNRSYDVKEKYTQTKDFGVGTTSDSFLILPSAASGYYTRQAIEMLGGVGGVGGFGGVGAPMINNAAMTSSRASSPTAGKLSNNNSFHYNYHNGGGGDAEMMSPASQQRSIVVPVEGSPYFYKHDLPPTVNNAAQRSGNVSRSGSVKSAGGGGLHFDDLVYGRAAVGGGGAVGGLGPLRQQQQQQHQKNGAAAAGFSNISTSHHREKVGSVANARSVHQNHHNASHSTIPASVVAAAERETAPFGRLSTGTNAAAVGVVVNRNPVASGYGGAAAASNSMLTVSPLDNLLFNGSSTNARSPPPPQSAAIQRLNSGGGLMAQRRRGVAASSPNSRNPSMPTSPRAAVVGGGGGGGGDLLPSYSNELQQQSITDWEMDPESGMYWSASHYLFLNGENGHFYDPRSDHWYDPDTGDWYPTAE